MLINSIASAIPKTGIYTASNRTSMAHSEYANTITQQQSSTKVQGNQPPQSTNQKSNAGKTEQADIDSRGRSKTRKSSSGRDDTSQSPKPQKLQLFSGNPTGISWSYFIMTSDRLALRRGWSDEKKIDRLYDCLTDKALEYASRSDNKDNFSELKKELAFRFDLREEPVAARQHLYLARQGEDDSLEAYLQRILEITMDGYKDANAKLLQQIATESFLRGCRHKDAATTVMNESPSTIHEACKRAKTILANKKAVGGGKVSFQERIFTVEEESRVSNIEKKVDELTKHFQRSSTSFRSPSRSPPRYSSGFQSQNWPTQSYDYFRGGSPSRPYSYNIYPTPNQGKYPYGGGYSPSNYPRGSLLEMVGTVQL